MCLFLTASIFAYGQTSSGKTYTMTGITEYSMLDIYDYIHKVCTHFSDCSLSFSFCEPLVLNCLCFFAIESFLHTAAS